jgi:hypothetical protein
VAATNGSSGSYCRRQLLTALGTNQTNERRIGSVQSGPHRVETELRLLTALNCNQTNELQSNRYNPGVVAPEWSSSSFVGNCRRIERSPCSYFSCQPKKYHSPRARTCRRAPMRSVFSSVQSVQSVSKKNQSRPERQFEAWTSARNTRTNRGNTD